MGNIIESVKRGAAVVLAAAVLAGCDDGHRETGAARPARDVSYFAANPAELAAVLAVCQANLRDAVSDTECRNARAALVGDDARETSAASVRDVPFYLAHPEEMTVKLASCRENPGGTLLDAECLNAKAAATRRATDPANRNMPKIGGPS